MGGLFSAPKVQEPPKAATDAQNAQAAQVEADRKRKAQQLAAQKRDLRRSEIITVCRP